MNIDDLTVKQIKEIASLANVLGVDDMSNKTDPDIGKYVVVRTFSAGVHCGVLVSRSGQEVRLSDARRIWRWYGAKTLHGVSQNGIDIFHELTNVDIPVPSIILTQAVEVIATSSSAEKCLREAKWNNK